MFNSSLIYHVMNGIAILKFKNTSIVESGHALYHNADIFRAGFELTTLVVKGTDCIGSYKSDYHKIKTTKAPCKLYKTFRKRYIKYITSSTQYLILP
jgi:hypothetical protein